jgi:hypothetical protein
LCDVLAICIVEVELAVGAVLGFWVFRDAVRPPSCRLRYSEGGKPVLKALRTLAGLVAGCFIYAATAVLLMAIVVLFVYVLASSASQHKPPHPTPTATTGATP